VSPEAGGAVRGQDPFAEEHHVTASVVVVVKSVTGAPLVTRSTPADHFKMLQRQWGDSKSTAAAAGSASKNK
jgi:hypothetical protein